MMQNLHWLERPFFSQIRSNLWAFCSVSIGSRSMYSAI